MKWYWWTLIGIVVVAAIIYFVNKNKKNNAKNTINNTRTISPSVYGCQYSTECDQANGFFCIQGECTRVPQNRVAPVIVSSVSTVNPANGIPK